MSPFKANYGYIPRTLLTLRQVKKISELVQKRVDRLMRLYLDLFKSLKLIQKKSPNILIKKNLKDQI